MTGGEARRRRAYLALGMFCFGLSLLALWWALQGYLFSRAVEERARLAGGVEAAGGAVDGDLERRLDAWNARLARMRALDGTPVVGWFIPDGWEVLSPLLPGGVVIPDNGGQKTMPAEVDPFRPGDVQPQPRRRFAP